MSNKNDSLIFNESASDIKNSPAILGTLEGFIADLVNPTRNLRFYPEKLWENVFQDPIVNELIENGGITGELDHPQDREETDTSRVAIIMKEKPVKKDGKLWAKFHILNTPLGRIAYTLSKAGFKFGISSRGSGETYTDAKGNEIVDADTYDFKSFDLVAIPAVKAARLTFTEGLNKKNKFDYKKALNEALSEANEDDRALMETTLTNLGIDYKEALDLLEKVDDTSKDEFIQVNCPVCGHNGYVKASEFNNHCPMCNESLDGSDDTSSVQLDDTIENNEDLTPVEDLKYKEAFSAMRDLDDEVVEENSAEELQDDDEEDKKQILTEEPILEDPIPEEIDSLEDNLDSIDESLNINESHFLQPTFKDGDIVFVGDAKGYHGTFLIKGDLTSIPTELYKNIRNISKYGNIDEPIYKVEYRLDSDSLFEKDYKEFFNYIKPLLSKNNIEVLDESLNINESAKTFISSYGPNDEIEIFYKDGSYWLRVNNEVVADGSLERMEKLAQKELKQLSDDIIDESFNINESAELYQRVLAGNTCIPFNILRDEYSNYTIESRGKTFKQKFNNSSDAIDWIESNYGECIYLDESLNINNEVTKSMAVDNDLAVVEELQEALKAKAKLEKLVMELQEKLSVGNSMETKNGSDVEKYKLSISKLTENAKSAEALKVKVSKLEETLTAKETELSRVLTESKAKDILIKRLEENQKLSISVKQSLKEKVDSKSNELNSINESLSQLNEKFNKERDTLNESIANLKKDIALKQSEYSSKMKKAKELIEQYKQTATTAKEKYIESIANNIGVSTAEIKSRLNENYEFEDIDNVVEELQDYKLTMNSLPFRLNENIHIKTTSSKKSILPASGLDDDVDDQLIGLAGLK